MEPIPYYYLAFVVGALGAIWFLFIRVKMDPRVEELARIAFECSADILGIKPKGKPPPVRLKKERWKIHGVSVVGNYKRYRIPGIGIMVWERVLAHISEGTFRTLGHEMAHVHRARRGEKVTEAEAEMVEAAIEARCGGARIAHLMAKLR